MGISRIARSLFFLIGFIVALAAIGLGAYSIWISRDSLKSILSGVETPSLEQFAEEAADVVHSIQSKSNVGDVGAQLEALKRNLSQFGQDAGPALREKLEKMSISLESAAESFSRRAKDFPERLAEVAEAARSLGAVRDGGSESAD
jgi:gas vesicle protein